MKRCLSMTVALVCSLPGCTPAEPARTTLAQVDAESDPVMVTAARADIDADGRADRISIRLIAGRVYDDTAQWEGAGLKYEGRFAVVVERAGREPVITGLNRLLVPRGSETAPLFFDAKPWPLHFADYNRDGRVDFNIGRYGTGAVSIYRLLTVSPDGTVSALPVAGQPAGFPGSPRTHSTAAITATENGFTHTFYSRRRGREVRRWYRWNAERMQFELSKQEPPETGGADGHGSGNSSSRRRLPVMGRTGGRRERVFDTAAGLLPVAVVAQGSGVAGAVVFG